MEKEIFVRYMDYASMLHLGTDYLKGYRYGLRRAHHGKKFGDDETIRGYQDRGGDLADGVHDGLNACPPRGMPPAVRRTETRGRPSRYDEPTVQVAFRCPVSVAGLLPPPGSERAAWLVAAVREKQERESE